MEITAIIYVNAIDERMIGKNICDFTLCKVYIGDNNLEHKVNHSISVWEYAIRLFEYHNDYNDKFVKHDNNGDYYLYFMKKYEVKAIEEVYDEAYNFIDSLVLFKKESLQLSKPYYFYENIGRNFIKIDLYKYYVDYPDTIYSLLDNEYEEIKLFYEIYSSFRKNKETNDIKNMIEIYFQARTINVKPVKFILYVTVVEMFVGVSSEISNQICKSVATLFADDYEKHLQISSNMKKIYKARSKYIHEGNEKKITTEIYNQCIDYARSIIKKLIEYNVKYNINLKDIQKYIKDMGVLVTDLESKIDRDNRSKDR